MPEILVLYYSPGGTTAEMADVIAHRVEEVDGMPARFAAFRGIAVTTQVEDDVPPSGPPYATPDDLGQCAGLVLGSPTHFGYMPAAMTFYRQHQQPLDVWRAGRSTCWCVHCQYQHAR